MNLDGDKIDLGLNLADDFTTTIKKSGNQITYSLPIYGGSNLSWFNEIEPLILELIENQGLEFKDHKFFIMVEKHVDSPYHNLSYFPTKDLVLELEQEDPAVLAFESVVTELQEKIKQVLLEQERLKSQIKSSRKACLTLL